MGRSIIMNHITSPELLAQINPVNKRLTRDFVSYLRTLQKSEGTISAYIGNLNIAFTWNLMFNDNKSFIDWTKRNVIAFQCWLIENNKNSPARVKQIKSTLSSLSNYIENILDDEYPTFRNIIIKIESPLPCAVLEKSIFTDEQIDDLLDYLTRIGKYDRACAVALARYSGRRKSELLRFKVSDFTPDRLICNGSLYKSDLIKTKGHGVNGKMMHCYVLADKFKPYLDQWLEFRSHIGLHSEWLFPKIGDSTKPLSKSTLTSWTKDFTEYLGIKFYWHALRHMCVTAFKKSKLPDSVIQAYIGWSSLDMVSLYSDIEVEDQLSAYFGNTKCTEVRRDEIKFDCLV